MCCKSKQKWTLFLQGVIHDPWVEKESNWMNQCLMYNWSDGTDATTMLQRNTQFSNFQECEMNEDTQAPHRRWHMVEGQKKQWNDQLRDTYVPIFLIAWAYEGINCAVNKVYCACCCLSWVVLSAFYHLIGIHSSYLWPSVQKQENRNLQNLQPARNRLTNHAGMMTILRNPS